MSLISTGNLVAPFTNKQHAIFIAVGVLMFIILRQVTSMTAGPRPAVRAPAIVPQAEVEEHVVERKDPPSKRLDPRLEIQRLGGGPNSSTEKPAKAADSAAQSDEFFQGLFGGGNKPKPENDKSGKAERSELADIEKQLGLR